MGLSPKQITLDQVYLKENFFLVRQEKTRKTSTGLYIPDSVNSMDSLYEVVKSKCADIKVGDFVAPIPNEFPCYEIGEGLWFIALTMDDIIYTVKQ
jgi:co-chaperonin GroES (HSP10)